MLVVPANAAAAAGIQQPTTTADCSGDGSKRLAAGDGTVAGVGASGA